MTETCFDDVRYLYTALRMLRSMKNIRDDGEGVMSSLELDWVRFVSHDRSNFKSPLLAPFGENAFAFLFTSLLGLVMIEMNDLALVEWVLARCDVIQVLLDFLRSPPFREHNVHIDLVFQFLMLCVSRPCDVAMRIWGNLHEHNMVGISLCFMESPAQQYASFLHAQLTSRDVIDFDIASAHIPEDHLAFIAKAQPIEALEHKNLLPGLWRLSLIHTGSVFDIGTNYTAYCIFEVDPDTKKVTGRGEMGRKVGAFTVSGTLSPEGMLHDFVMTRVEEDGGVAGSEFVFSGSMVPLSGIYGGRIGAREVGSDIPPSHLAMKASFVMWKDVRAVSIELEEDAKAWILSSCSEEEGTLLVPAGRIGPDFAVYDQIEQFYKWLLQFERNAVRMQHWSFSSLASVGMSEQELLTIHEDVFHQVKVDWAKQAKLVRGPHERDADYERRCMVLNATLQMVQLLRPNVCKGFLSDLDYMIDLLRSTRPEFAADVSQEEMRRRSARAAGFGTIWVLRLNYCPDLLISDEPLSLRHLLDLLERYSNGIRGELEQEREASENENTDTAAAAAIASSSLDSSKKRKRKGKSNKNAFLQSTTSIIIAAGAFAAALTVGAFFAGKWLANRKDSRLLDSS